MRWCVACIVIELSQTALASLSCNLANSLDLAPVLLVCSRVLGLDRADLDLFLLPTQAVGLNSCGSSVWAHCRFLRPRAMMSASPVCHVQWEATRLTSVVSNDINET